MHYCFFYNFGLNNINSWEGENIILFYFFVFHVITYANSDLLKLDILKDNNDKSGVYRWVNLTNGKSYVGSSVNLNSRLNQYYNKGYLDKEIKRNKSIIYKALKEYGYFKFGLEIL